LVSHDKNGNPSEKDLEQEKFTFESIVRYNVPVTVIVEITPTDN
jgi:hypothetical protein